MGPISPHICRISNLPFSIASSILSFKALQGKTLFASHFLRKLFGIFSVDSSYSALAGFFVAILINSLLFIEYQKETEKNKNDPHKNLTKR